jgi:predicted dehydrogenase
MKTGVCRVGVLGMGGMGTKHSNCILKMADAVLVALCSSPIDDARKYKDKNQLDCAVYDDGFEMIEKEDLDILYVCLPPFAHCGQVEAAAKKGIAIFIEKPLALTAERGLSMLNAVKEAGVCSQVGYHMRFGGAVKMLKKLIEDGTAGKPTLFTANYECNSLHKPWWIDVTKSGGQVFEQVIHLYDTAMYFMGEPSCVSGFVANQCHGDVPGYTVEDTSISAIRFKNGSLGGISGSNCAVKKEWNGRFRVVCEKLVADFSDFNNAVFIYTDQEEKRIESICMDINPYFEEDSYFLSVVRGNKPQCATISEGYLGLQMVNAVVTSSRENGQSVKIK